jgi:hypothetical protein
MDFARAIALCQESLSLNRELGDPRGVLASVSAFADIAVVQGQFERGVRLMAAVQTQLALLGMRLLPVDKMEYERNLAQLRAQFDARSLNKFWAKGKELSLEQVIAFALNAT